MKIPTKIRMFGYDWKVVVEKDENRDGCGDFSWKTKTIRINNRWGEKETIFLHEVIEAILLENLVRYYGNEGNSEYKFIFNHTEFCKIIRDISQVFKDNKLF